MVQTLTRQSLDIGHDTPRPEALRITGMGVAITLNAAFALWLSIPKDQVYIPPAPKPVERMDVVEIREVRPAPVEPVPAMPEPPEFLPQPRTEAPPREQRTIVEQTSNPIPITAPTTPVDGPVVESALPAFSAPPTAVTLLRAPAPPFPAAELRRGHQGTVLLRVLVGVDGLPREVDVLQSSGYAALDRHALEFVQQRWRFNPAIRDGRAVPALVEVPIEFSIDRR